jgi:type 1 glutamine amidotransferase
MSLHCGKGRTIANEQSAPGKPIQALIVTGADLHNWRATAPVLAEELQKDPRIKTTVVQDPHSLGTMSLDSYNVIVLHFMNWKVPAPGEAARNNLKKSVEDGKGLVLVHFACGAWQDWPEFKNLAGRVWDPKLRAHDPRGPFRVDILSTGHPITEGLESFETNDELYTCLAGDRPVDVLATARSKVDGKDYPMAFAFQCGKGRVFHCVLGHDVQALSNPSVAELFRRGTAWAAGLSY